MVIIKCKDYQEVSKKAAAIVIREMIKDPELNLGLATGSTPIGLYNRLIKAYEDELISFKDVNTFNLDEYIGIPKTHPQSYYSFMQKNLFSKVDVKEENIHLPLTQGEDLDALADEYSALLRDNIIDVQVLGIGTNGHIGFNEPGTPFRKKTFVVELNEQTRQDNARFFDSVEDVPAKAMTMGIKNIMRAKKIILMATGENKAEAIYIRFGKGTGR